MTTYLKKIILWVAITAVGLYAIQVSLPLILNEIEMERIQDINATTTCDFAYDTAEDIQTCQARIQASTVLLESPY